MPNWHSYYTTEDQLCIAIDACNAALVQDAALRFAIPGRSPLYPIQNKGIYEVYGPGGFDVGSVKSFVGDNGFWVLNLTQQDHLLYNGEVIRMIYKSDNDWLVATIGYGNNTKKRWAELNKFFGPDIFEYQVDVPMEEYIANEIQ